MLIKGVAELGGAARLIKVRKPFVNVNKACIYCRRSHMTCDSGRPCSRCIKRCIGHLCHDETVTSKPSREARKDHKSFQPTSDEEREPMLIKQRPRYPAVQIANPTLAPNVIPSPVLSRPITPIQTQARKQAHFAKL